MTRGASRRSQAAESRRVLGGKTGRCGQLQACAAWRLARLAASRRQMHTCEALRTDFGGDGGVPRRGAGHCFRPPECRSHLSQVTVRQESVNTHNLGTELLILQTGHLHYSIHCDIVPTKLDGNSLGVSLIKNNSYFGNTYTYTHLMG